MHIISSILAALLLSSTLVVAAIPPSHYPADVAALMNFTADPCTGTVCVHILDDYMSQPPDTARGSHGTDFYNYACGGWIANATLPSDEPIFLRAITNIELTNAAALQQVLQQNDSSKYPLIQPFYKMCMDTATIESQGTAALQDIWAYLGSITDLSDFMGAIGVLHEVGLPGLFAFSVVADPGNPQVQIRKFKQRVDARASAHVVVVV